MESWTEQEITGQGPVLTKPKPQSSSRIVAMPSLLVAGTDAHLSAHVAAATEALVFTNNTAAQWGPRWSEAWQQMRAETGLHELRLHDLRHPAGTLTAQAGGTP